MKNLPFLLVIFLFYNCSSSDCTKEDFIGKYKGLGTCLNERIEITDSFVDTFDLNECTLSKEFGREKFTAELMNNILIIRGVGMADTFSCDLEKINFSCNCSGNAFNPSITYYRFDVVQFNGQCWEAVEQGKGIVPGPWLVNGNDIWKVCIE